MRTERADRWKSGIDYAVVLLFFIGFFLTPIHIRAPILVKNIGYYGYINLPCVFAIILTFTKIGSWGKEEIIFAILWGLMCIPMIISNSGQAKTIPSYFQNLLPLAFLLFRMKEKNRSRILKLFILLFDIFMICFLFLGIEEMVNNKYILTQVRDFLELKGYKATEYTGYIWDYRFGSIWGHPLTASLLFNLFFAVNLVYCRSFKNNGARYTLPLFAISLCGVLLASSKTGLVICFLLLIVSYWKYKKYFLLVIPILVILYFIGAFDGIIRRFESTSLTTGRIEAFTAYCQTGTNPILWFNGYGAGSIMDWNNPDFVYRAGFEFPEFMFAYDFGIIFSIVTMGGAFVYCTYKLLKRRDYYTWFCYTLIFAHESTYNGYSLRNQDVCWLFNFISMIILNISHSKDMEK